MQFYKEYVNQAIKDLGFKQLTEIQEIVIPEALKKRDIIGCSQTGSGKSHAFLIPVFERLNESNPQVQTVILSPTRELALQLYDAVVHIASFSETPIDIRLYTGGKDRAREMERLKKHQPQIVIGTPGKVYDLAIKENLLKIYTAQQLIIDEADMALEIGFLDDIDAIARTMPKSLQMMVFSATVPEKLKPFLRKYLEKPFEVNIEDKSLSSLNITHRFIRVLDEEDRDRGLFKWVEQLNPYLCLIFANKKEHVDRLAKALYQKNENVVALHGDIPPRKRKQILKDINRLKYQYVVASDMASRGLDIEGVSHIINYDLPKDMAFFVHRIGRTGRMGASGETISFFTGKDAHAFEFIEKHNIKIELKGTKPPMKQTTKKRTSKPSIKKDTKPTRKKRR